MGSYDYHKSKLMPIPDEMFSHARKRDLGRIVHIARKLSQCGEYSTVLREHEHGFSRTKFKKGPPKSHRVKYSWIIVEHKQWMKGEEV